MTTTTTPPTAAVRRAPVPLRAAKACYPAVALAVLVVALGAVAVRDAVLAAGWIAGEPWLPGAVEALEGLSPAAWTAAAGVVAAAAGIALLAAALAPRRPRGVPLDAHSTVYLDLTDVARVASAAAEGVPGVVSARTSAGRRAVLVSCRATGALDRAVIAEAVTAALTGVTDMPKVKVRINTRDAS